MKILALDPATKLGFAHSCGLSGTEDFSIRARESTGSRLRRLYGWLGRFYDDCPFDMLVFESAIVYTKHASGVGVSFEMQGVILLWCEERTGIVDYRGFNVAEVKKHATGKGNAGKPAMNEAACVKWPDHNFGDDNEVDACWLLDLAQKEFGG